MTSKLLPLLASFPLFAACPARAWVTVSESADTKVELEFRTMSWVTHAGRESLGGQDGAVTDCSIRRGRVALRVKSGKKLGFQLQIGQDNIGGKLQGDDAAVKVKDLFVEYRASEGFQVTAGQFKVPFLRHNLESGFNQLLVDRAAVASLRPARAGARDVGAMVLGTHFGWQYRLALFDGSDQELDNPESSPRVTARLAHNWFNRESGANYTGTALGAKRVLQLAAQLDHQNHRLDGRDATAFRALPRDYRAWALDGFLELPWTGGAAVTLEGAWVERDDDYRDPTVSDRETRGHYAQLGFLLPGTGDKSRLQLALRHERTRERRGDLDSSQRAVTAGANWYFNGHNSKLQADYSFRREPSTEKTDDQLRLSLVAVF